MKKVVVIIFALFLMLNSCKTKQNNLCNFKIDAHNIAIGDASCAIDTLKPDTLKHKCCTEK